MFEILSSFQFTNRVGLVTYWAPFVVCAVGYCMMIWDDFQKDVRQRDLPGTYVPTLTLGTLVAAAFLTSVPVVNVLAAIFSAGPLTVKTLYTVLEATFDIPLVPRRRKVVKNEPNKEGR